MSKQHYIIIALIFLGLIFSFLLLRSLKNGDSTEGVIQDQGNERIEGEIEREEEQFVEIPRVEVLAENLEVPWGLAFLPDGDVLVAERPGRLVRIGENGATYTIEGVEHVGEGGLLGVALHPDFSTNQFIYIYFTTRTSEGLENRIERYRLRGGTLEGREIILSEIPGARNHDGGRIEFGPDKKLYVTTGDAQSESSAQDLNILSGKILRINDDGSIPADNPFGTPVWSYGHRNPQGLSWDRDGRLWSTEHGRSGILSGFDEINIILPGRNYGWPVIQGDEAREGMASPVYHSGGSTTWAPASAAYHNGSLYFGGLISRTLYQAVLDDDRVVELRKHLVGDYGRIRTVVVGPEDGMLYITTSNTDGRATPQRGDDKVIRINPEKL